MYDNFIVELVAFTVGLAIMKVELQAFSMKLNAFVMEVFFSIAFWIVDPYRMSTDVEIKV